MRRLLILCLALAVAMPQASAADKASLRKTSKETAAKLRSAGEPLDRCYIGSLATGPVITRIAGPSELKPGDKLVAIGDAPVAEKSVDEVVAMLRRTAPNATLRVSIERDGQAREVSVTCANSRPTYERLLAALDLAARGKFDECASAISGLPSLDTQAMGLGVDCASLARNVTPSEFSGMLAQLLQMAIEDARYVPSARPAIAAQLRSSEGLIAQGQSPERFQSLISATRQWPGGETVYTSSAPDWALFRRNAEAALRSRLIDPDSARIQWNHGFMLGQWKPFLAKPVEGYWSCGLINARNRMGGYTGSTAFVVVLDPSGYVKYSEIGDAKDFDILSASCAKSVKMLPPPPAELVTDARLPAASGSLADEIKKLSDLRNAGALSEAEFEAAKTKLLQSEER